MFVIRFEMSWVNNKFNCLLNGQILSDSHSYTGKLGAEDAGEIPFAWIPERAYAEGAECFSTLWAVLVL